MPKAVDLSEFEAAGKPKGPMCSVKVALALLDKERSAKLAAALVTTGITTSQICRVLDGWGQPVGINTIQRHRRGECACGR